jgi:anthranilate phosphoribosyltransferase
VKPSSQLTEALTTLLQGEALTMSLAFAAMNEIVSGQAPAARIAAFLTALRLKGETPEEIAGCAKALRRAMVPVQTRRTLVADTCGTGGDGKNSFNVSTAAAFVVAGAGVPVAKHGNRSVSSRCGSAEVLEALGVNPEMEPALAERALEKIGIAFLFAPRFHPAIRHAMPVRRELGFRTVFNCLGPLSNPARANAQLIGVPEKRLVETLSRALSRLGEKRGLVVHTNGWDEVTLTGATTAARIKKGVVRHLSLTPRDFGLAPVKPRDLTGGNARRNADIILSVLKGRPGPQRRVVVANAACTLWIAGGISGRDPISLKEAVQVAEYAIDSGAALEKLKKLANMSPSTKSL